MSASKYLWWPFDLVGCHLLGKNFVGGWSIEDVLRTGAELKKRGYRVTYNLMGERVRNLATVGRAVETTLELISSMDESNRGNVSLKPTLYGLEISRGEFYFSVETIIREARDAGIGIEFDAEELEFIPDTFFVFQQFAEQLQYRGFVRQAVQAHRAELYQLMNEYKLWNKPLRVVEGSGVYAESGEHILLDRSSVRSQYWSVIRTNHAAGQTPYIATVRDRSKVAEAERILPSPHMYELEMLYGPLGAELRGEQLAKGKTVRVYIPFVVDWCKDEWKPYGMRRSASIRHLFWQDAEVRRAILKEVIKRLV